MRNTLKAVLLIAAAFLASGVAERPRGVFFDQRSSSTTVTATDPTWNHTPRGRVAGVVVFCLITDTSTDVYTGATYGGTAMTSTQTANDTATELAFTEAYFLGASIPQGTQQVICDSSDTTLNKAGLALTVGADEATTSDAGSCGVSENIANPSCTITGITRESLSLIGGFSGATAASVTANAGFTRRNSLGFDAGSYYSASQNYMQVSGNNVTGMTVGSDDVAMTAVAVQQ